MCPWHYGNTDTHTHTKNGQSGSFHRVRPNFISSNFIHQISNEMNACVLINNDEVSYVKLNAATYLVSFDPDGFDILLDSDKETKNFTLLL